MGDRDYKHSIPVTRVGGMRGNVEPAWQRVYTYIKSSPIDSHISFDSLSEVLGFNAKRSGRMPIGRAWQELEKEGLTLERDEHAGYFLRKM